MLWRLITHHETQYRNDALNWYRGHHLIALGWGHIGDLRNLQPRNQDDIWNLYWQTYGSTGNTNNGNNCKKCLWRFWKEMAIGDEVILVTNFRVCVVEVTGDYSFDINYPPGVSAHNLTGYFNRRTVKEVGSASYANKLWDDHNRDPGTNIYNALIKLV